MTRGRSILLYLIIALLVLGLDLWTKSAAFSALGASVTVNPNPPPPVHFVHGREIEVIPGCFSLEASYNLGAFSGWFSQWPRALFAISILAVIVTFIIVCAKRHGPMLVTCLGLLAGGALGNLYDRMYLGAVRDFIKFYYGSHVWPNFNIADSAICVGVGLLFLREYFIVRAARRESATASMPESLAKPEE